MAKAKKAAETPEKKEVKLLTFEVGGKKYQFVNNRCHLPGRGVVYQEQMIEEPATLENLVAIKSGVIKAL